MDSRKTHRDTANGFDAIAASKYRAEFTARLDLLRTGGHGLLENPGFPAAAVRDVHPGPGRPALRERFWRPDQVMAALAKAGLRHESYRELPDLFWDHFPHWSEQLRPRLPHSHSLRYRLPADAESGAV